MHTDSMQHEQSDLHLYSESLTPCSQFITCYLHLLYGYSIHPECKQLTTMTTQSQTATEQPTFSMHVSEMWDKCK